MYLNFYPLLGVEVHALQIVFFISLLCINIFYLCVIDFSIHSGKFKVIDLHCNYHTYMCMYCNCISLFFDLIVP